MHREYPSTLTLTHKHMYTPTPTFPLPPFQLQSAVLEFFNNLWGARNRVGIGLWYRLQRMAELIPLNRFLGSLKVKNSSSDLNQHDHTIPNLTEPQRERHGWTITWRWFALLALDITVSICALYRRLQMWVQWRQHVGSDTLSSSCGPGF